MAEVGSAFVTVVPSAKGFGSKLQSQVGGEVDGAGKGIGSKFGTAIKLGATAALGGAVLAAGFLKGALSEARDAQKVGALTNAVIKSTGGIANVTAKDVDKLSTSISLKTGIDDEAIAAGQNMLLTFGNVRNEVGKGNDIFRQATITASDMAAAFGGDAVSNSKLLGKALNDPTAGVSALTRVGVSFTAQQKEQIKTLQLSGNVLGAQKVILGEVSKQTAGAAESQATAGDKLRTAFGNLQESVGTALLPLFDRLLNGLSGFAIFLTNDIGPGLAALNGFLQPVIVRVREFFGALSGGGGFSAIGASIMGFVNTLRANFVPVLQQAAATFTGLILPAVKSLGQYLAAALFPIFQRVAGIIANQVIPIVAKLAQFFYGTLYPAILQIVRAVASNLKPVFDQLVATFRSSVLPTVQALLVKFEQYRPTIQRVILVAVQVIGKFLEFGAAIAGRVLPVVIRFGGYLISNLVPAIASAIGIGLRIIATFINIGAAFIDGAQKIGKFAAAVQGKIDAAVGFVREVPGKITAVFSGAATLLINAGSQLMSGLAAGIRSRITAAVDEVKAGLSKIKDLLPGSPIKNGPLKGWNGGRPGKALMEMLAAGIASGGKKAATAAVDAATKIRDSVKTKLDQVKSDFASMRDSVATAFTGNLFEGDTAASFVEGLLGTKSQLTNLAAAFKSLTKLGLSPGFLAQLFQSGNAGLILDLAANPAAATQSAALFKDVDLLGQQLGTAVAKENLGPKMDVLASNLEIANTAHQRSVGHLAGIERALDKLAEKTGKAVGDEINAVTKSAGQARPKRLAFP